MGGKVDLIGRKIKGDKLDPFIKTRKKRDVNSLCLSDTIGVKSLTRTKLMKETRFS